MHSFAKYGSAWSTVELQVDVKSLLVQGKIIEEPQELKVGKGKDNLLVHKLDKHKVSLNNSK